nr:hypothetical protein Iba_chr03fCG3280 [Ipomoea batatas]
MHSSSKSRRQLYPPRYFHLHPRPPGNLRGKLGWRPIRTGHHGGKALASWQEFRVFGLEQTIDLLLDILIPSTIVHLSKVEQELLPYGAGHPLVVHIPRVLIGVGHGFLMEFL